MKSWIIGLAMLACACPIQAQFAPPNDQGVSFGHMHLVVADIELHKRLWPELFGAKLVEKQGYTAVWIDEAQIFFREGEPTAPSISTSVDHFGLKVRNVEAVLSRWIDLGYEIDSRTTNSSGQSIAFITMPGGVRLALREEPDQRTSSSMGYVQFVSSRPDELMAWYAQLFGISTIDVNERNAVAEIPGSGLRFTGTATERLPTEGTAIDHIGFEVQNWDAFVEALRQADIQFEFGPVYIESLDLWVAFFNDPSGVLVEITHGLEDF